MPDPPTTNGLKAERHSPSQLDFLHQDRTTHSCPARKLPHRPRRQDGRGDAHVLPRRNGRRLPTLGHRSPRLGRSQPTSRRALFFCGTKDGTFRAAADLPVLMRFAPTAKLGLTVRPHPASKPGAVLCSYPPQTVHRSGLGTVQASQRFIDWFTPTSLCGMAAKTQTQQKHTPHT